VYVPLPDAATRLEIFSIHKRKTPFGDDVILDSLVEKTDGYSGAEVINFSANGAQNVNTLVIVISGECCLS